MQYLAFDIGGTDIKHALVDPDGWVLSEAGAFPTATTSSPATLIEALGRVYDAHAGAVAGVAISSAGELDPATGHFFNGGALRYTAGLDLLDAAAPRFGVPISVENDANCALLAEAADGALAGVRDGCVLIVGTGLGGALLLDGRLHRGAHFYAGSFSMPLRSIDEPFVLDDVAAPSQVYATGGSARALTARLAARLGRPAAEVDGRLLFDLVEAGDPVATAVLTEHCALLARIVYNVHVLVDLEVVAVGGGISRRPVFVETLRRELDALLDAMAPWIAVPRPRLVPCRHSADANLIGAVVHHRASLAGPDAPGTTEPRRP